MANAEQKAYQRAYYLRNSTRKKELVKKWAADNPEKRKAAEKRWRGRHKLDRRNAQLRRLYGITLKEYQEMLIAQEGACFLCRRIPVNQILHVDHHHKTKKVRKLLCLKCNVKLGFIEANPDLVIRMWDYLFSEAANAA